MIAEEEKIPVFLTKEQVALFILFQQHYDKVGFMFKVLMEDGVFDTKLGSATLNFDRSGNLLSIKRELLSHFAEKTVDNRLAV